MDGNGETRETRVSYRGKGLNHDPKTPGSRDSGLRLHSAMHSLIRSLTKHPPAKPVAHTEDMLTVESKPAPIEIAFQLCDLKKVT